MRMEKELYGDPNDPSKQHTGITYLPRAWDAGATSWIRTRARRIVVERGRAVAVEARTAGGGRLRVDAGHVVVSVGTVHTPLLLARSRACHRP